MRIEEIPYEKRFFTQNFYPKIERSEAPRGFPEPYWMDESRGLYLFQGAAEELTPLLMRPGSVDLIMTDPRYDSHGLRSYRALREIAETTLKPGALLFAYTGAEFLPEVMEMLSTPRDLPLDPAIPVGPRRGELEWFYLFNDRHSIKPRMFTKALMVSSKPILAFRRSGYSKSRDSLAWTHTDSEGKADKRYHKWGQGSVFTAYHISKRTDPGYWILDPYAGGGRTLEVCRDLSRNCLTFEIDELACERIATRMSQQVLDLGPPSDIAETLPLYNAPPDCE